MPRIFDNIEQQLLPVLRETLAVSDRADFCVGYFNLRGWKALDSNIERWSGGDGHCCRLLVGMQRLPDDEPRAAIGIAGGIEGIDNATALRLKRTLAENFRDQLALGAPTNDDEAGLRRLAAQIKARKVVVKFFLEHPLHAKLYLLFRPDRINPIVGYLGSSNLTMAGLSGQGELNIDVLDHDACQKLARWFTDRWDDRWCVDISEELLQVLDESWATESPRPPYHIYLKIAYHLAEDARRGLLEFRIPADFRNQLFAYQEAAVKIAARHLNNRGGVLIGDVVGLGKTLMATALARVFEDDHYLETLILCPKNLVPMWEDYRTRYRLRATVLSLSQVTRRLPGLARHRIVLIDESHNLRNRGGKRYRAIQDYISKNDSKCILLTATPYNKTYLDLSNQLRLFIAEDADLGIRPENRLRELGETEFIRLYQCPLRSLAAFEKSLYADDWRELMRLYLVRRTRSFVKENYATTDPVDGRKYLPLEDGRRFYFPARSPETLKFRIRDDDRDDQYARLYDNDVVNAIERLELPRYGLGNYLAPTPRHPPTSDEGKLIADLNRAGKRLKGFCRTNLFKRLESSGHAFLQSLHRHILRNYVFLHAIENDLPIPLGAQGAELLDARVYDEDADDTIGALFDDDEDEESQHDASADDLRGEPDFKARAAEVYTRYAGPYKRRFKWLRPGLFIEQLGADLRSDARSLMGVLGRAGDWDPRRDAKLEALVALLIKKHPNDKVLIFSQFADTVRYLETQLRQQGVERLAGATGDTGNPTALAWRFSPHSNDKRTQVSADEELRVLLATDVLSEGQNLQDCAIVVNFDLPWAIIRLVQRAGRVDRIGQAAETIHCYSFLPADGVERIIRLRLRVRQRLRENAEVVGTDEAFFEDDRNDQAVRDLFTEKAGILDDDDDAEVDLASRAFQIWQKAVEDDPSLEKTIAALPGVVYSAKAHTSLSEAPEGVLAYLRTAQGNDALFWINDEGASVTESQFTILKAAECQAETPAVPRHDRHHALVGAAVKLAAIEEKSVGGALGRPSGAKFRTYERLNRYVNEIRDLPLFDVAALRKAVEEIFRYPLYQAAIDALNRQLRSGVSDETLAELVVTLRSEGRLCVIHDEQRIEQPRIICSLGLRASP